MSKETNYWTARWNCDDAWEQNKNGRAKWYTVIRFYRNLYLTLLFIPLSRLRVLLRHFPNLLINCFNLFSSARSFNVSTPYTIKYIWIPIAHIVNLWLWLSSWLPAGGRWERWRMSSLLFIICLFFFGWICSFLIYFIPACFLLFLTKIVF